MPEENLPSSPSDKTDNTIDNGASAPWRKSDDAENQSGKPADNPGHVAQDATAPDNTLSTDRPEEYGGQSGPEPTRYGDWEKKGRCTDF